MAHLLVDLVLGLQEGIELVTQESTQTNVAIELMEEYELSVSRVLDEVREDVDLAIRGHDTLSAMRTELLNDVCL